MANCCFTEYAIYIAPNAAGGSGDLEQLHASFLRKSEKCFSTLTALMRSEHVSPEKLAAAGLHRRGAHGSPGRSERNHGRGMRSALDEGSMKNQYQYDSICIIFPCFFR